MAKQTTSKPKAVAPATAVTVTPVTPVPDAEALTGQASAGDAATTGTETKIEEAALPQGTASLPTPLALGNEGLAPEAGEGQPSLADLAGAKIPEDGVMLSDFVRVRIDWAKPAASELSAELAALGVAPSLIVTGPKKGRWRIGRKFGPEPVTLLAADLTEDEMEALAADKTLTITAVAPPY